MCSRTLRLLTLLTTSFVAVGTAGAAADFYDYAPVIDARPIVEEVRVLVPREHCWRHEVRRRHGQRSYTPAIVGGIVGGVLGSQIGHGDRRRVATIAGSLLGASIGKDWQARSHPPGYRTGRRCEVVDHYEEEQRVVGFRVRYRYQGHTFVTRMAEDPGDEVRVRVSLNPDY